jgi:glycosyltransferase involved in cell wall biosynthesis
MSNPSVCVVVPILNEARYIRESIESLLAQDYAPLEIVVYDAGSTDGTLEILSQYPVEVVVEPGLGQMAAINRGWRRTQAEFVTWWAGDDRYKPGALARLAAALRAHPEAGVVHAEADIIDADGHVVGHLAPGAIGFDDLAIEFTMVSQTTLIRRSALALSGMMDEQRRFSADWDLFLRLSQHVPFQYERFTACEYRTHGGSEDNRNLVAAGIGAVDVIDSFFRRTDLTEAQRRRASAGRAGARLFAAWCAVVAGSRARAWRLLAEAMRLDPRVVFTSRAGPRLVARLLVPVTLPAQLLFRRRVLDRVAR